MTRKPRSDANSSIQIKKEIAVQHFKKKFPYCKKNIFGLIHNILTGEKQFRRIGVTDLSILLELVDKIPADVEKPNKVLCQKVKSQCLYNQRYVGP